MAETLSLYEFIQKLISDHDLRELFFRNPDQALEDHGLSDLSEADVRDALVLVDDGQTADFSREYNTGHNSIGGGSNGRHESNHDRDNDRDDDHDHDGGHRDAVEHLSRFITNNYVDDRDTIVDNSVNQNIDTHGGDFDQDIDIDSHVASGDGAVAADDIRDSNVVTGDHNVVGDGNVTGDDNITGDDNQVVSGDDNNTSFGEGDATSTHIGGDVTVGAGGGFATGGDTTVDNTDNSTDIRDSGNTDNSVHDSGNTHIEDSFQDNHETRVDDSFQDNSDHSDHSDNSDSSTHEQDNSVDLDIH